MKTLKISRPEIVRTFHKLCFMYVAKLYNQFETKTRAFKSVGYSYAPDKI